MKLNVSVRNIFWAISLLFLSLVNPSGLAFANPPAPEVPDGFFPVASTFGIELYRKDYPKGNPDFVQIVDLSVGASIEVLHGEIEGKGEGKGVYGGTSPKMSYRTLQSYWQELASVSENPFCVMNGQFFYMKDNPTKLSLPIKKDGQLVTEGYAALEFLGETLMLEIWPDHADIRELTHETLYQSQAPDIIGGLIVTSNKRAKQYTGRTFVGVDDRDQNGTFESVLVFNTKTARQVDAAEVLISFGADKVMMLDGGGSTQLTCQGESLVFSERLIPQAFGTAGAVLPPFSAGLVLQPNWPVVTANESLTMKIRLKNRGSEMWTPDLTQMVLQDEFGAVIETVPIQGNVAYGEEGIFQWSLTSPDQPGVFVLRWSLTQQESPFLEEPYPFTWVVIPEELAAFRSDLDGKVQYWNDTQPENIPSLVDQWIREQQNLLAAEPQQSKKPLAFFSAPVNQAEAKQAEMLSFSAKGLLLIPIAILPVAFLLFWHFNSRFSQKI